MTLHDVTTLHKVTTYTRCAPFPNDDITEEFMMCEICGEVVCCYVDDKRGGFYAHLIAKGEKFRISHCTRQNTTSGKTDQ
jgi:hypothetical protein